MALKLIDLTTPQPGGKFGDPTKTAWEKTNDNTVEIEQRLQIGESGGAAGQQALAQVVALESDLGSAAYLETSTLASSSTVDNLQVQVSNIAASQGSGVIGVASLADIPTGSLGPGDAGKMYNVTNDPIAANNGAWRWSGASLTQAEDRVSILQKTLPQQTRESLGVSQTVTDDGQGSIEIILDENGIARILAVYSGDAQFLGDTPNAWRNPQFSIENSIVVALESDPDHAELIFDDQGVYRVLSAYGPLINGPVVYGADISPSGGEEIVPLEYVVFLIAGQSNAQGIGKASLSPKIPEKVAYQYWGGVLSPLSADPIGNADTGSAWAEFSVEFFNRTGMGVVLVPAAVGNSALTVAASTVEVGGNGNNWTSPNGLRLAAVTSLQGAISAISEINLAWRFGGILWSQGERDSRCLPNATSNPGVITEAEYRTAFENLVSYFNAQIGYSKWPFIISMTGGDTEGIDADALASMRELQRIITQEIQQARFGWTGAFNLIERGLMRWHDFPGESADRNRSHYSQQGYNEMGRAMAVVAAAYSI